MKIYQVEELVGITKKNIRFYEDQGLLCPNRNPQNDYREYSLDDVSKETFCEYMQYLRLIDVLNFIDDEEQRETILTAIQNQGWDVAEMIADEYPILQPFLKDYTESEADE